MSLLHARLRLVFAAQAKLPSICYIASQFHLMLVLCILTECLYALGNLTEPQLFTDVMLGNLIGGVSIHTQALDLKGDSKVAASIRWLENQLLRFLE
eukprot:m.4482 g.4482  ORF g.4482 m.4482 type:complete len:97 (+) comp4501_c0_seq1:780-1070(+)